MYKSLLCLALLTLTSFSAFASESNLAKYYYVKPSQIIAFYQDYQEATFLAQYYYKPSLTIAKAVEARGQISMTLAKYIP